MPTLPSQNTNLILKTIICNATQWDLAVDTIFEDRV